MEMGYDGGINSATCDSGNAKAVSVTAPYTAPEAPKEGRISGTAFLATVVAAPEEAATAVAHVSVVLTVLAGEVSCATMRG